MRWLEALALVTSLAFLVATLLFTDPVSSPGLRPGLEEVRELAEGGETDAALLRGHVLLVPNAFAGWRRTLEVEEAGVALSAIEVLDPLFTLLQLSGLSRRERAHVQFALATVHAGAEEDEENPGGHRAAARRELRSALAGAGSGDLRLDAQYDLGTLSLLEGEEWRAQLPELGGQPPAGAQATVPMGAPPAPGADAPEPPDPLEQARGAYLEAKEHFVVRLRLDFEDADTRANTELVMRRLRELDEIEQQRQEQQQEQEDQQQDPQEQEDQQDSQQDEQQPEEQQDQQDSQEEGQDPRQEEPEPQEPPEEPEPQEPEDQPGEEETEEQPPEERFLTKEEVQRLLERLKEHEQRGEELRERMRARRRRPTARDW